MKRKIKNFVLWALFWAAVVICFASGDMILLYPVTSILVVFALAYIYVFARANRS